MIPVMARIITSHAVADRNRRVASELPRIREGPQKASPPSFSGRWRRQEIAEPSHGLDDINVQLLAYPAHKNFDGVRVTVKILVVEMLYQLGARNHPS